MIKKAISVFAVLAFAFGILYVSVLSSCKNVHPSLAMANEASASPTLTEATPEAKIDYYLVYPGMLPDHPLYKIKMVRDRIWVWLTPNPLRKANLLLLFADKRVGAGKVLIEGNKVSLGISTLVKGEKYLERAVSQTIELKQDKKNISELAGRLRRAILKHQEIIEQIYEKVNSEGKIILEGELKLLENLQEKAQTF